MNASSIDLDFPESLNEVYLVFSRELESVFVKIVDNHFVFVFMLDSAIVSIDEYILLLISHCHLFQFLIVSQHQLSVLFQFESLSNVDIYRRLELLILTLTFPLALSIEWPLILLSTIHFIHHLIFQKVLFNLFLPLFIIQLHNIISISSLMFTDLIIILFHCHHFPAFLDLSMFHYLDIDQIP